MRRRTQQKGWTRAAAVLAVTVASATAVSQPAPAGGGGPAQAGADATVAAVVKQHYAAGRAAADAKQWPKAAEEFGKAYALKPLPQLAGNLGEAELRIGRFRDAAEHIDRFLREDKGALPEDKKAGEGWLTEAKKKIVTLKIAVDEAGAEVLIDDKAIGTSPLPPEVYVDPGKHTVVARKGTARAEATDTYEAGWTRVMKLVIQEPGAVSTATATGSTTGPVATTSPPSTFPARTVVLAGGAAVTLVGLAIGIAGTVISAGKAGERDAVCSTDCPRAGEPNYQETKDKWASLDGERVSNANMGAAGFVVGGIAAVGTGLVYFVWKSGAPKSDKVQGLTVVPAGAGVVVKANW